MSSCVVQRPAALRLTARVLAWLMAADAVLYLAWFAIVWIWPSPATWSAVGWWTAAARARDRVQLLESSFVERHPSRGAARTVKDHAYG